MSLSFLSGPTFLPSHLCYLNGKHKRCPSNVSPFRYTAIFLPLSVCLFPWTTQTITGSDVSVSECVTVCVLCIWASVTAQMTAQCTSEHPVLKCQLSGIRTVTVLSKICCPCDTMCLTPVYNKGVTLYIKGYDCRQISHVEWLILFLKIMCSSYLINLSMHWSTDCSTD